MTRFGPRKRIGLAALVTALAIVGFLTSNVLLIAITAAGLLILLLIVTLTIELLRWRNVQKRRTDNALRSLTAEKQRSETALRSLTAEKQRSEAALRSLGVARSKLTLALMAANDDRMWRDIRAGVSQAGTRQRTRLFVYPMNGVNAYLKLIYQEFPRWDFDVVPLSRVADLDAAQNGDVVHYHWTKHVQYGCATAEKARAASDALLAQFRTLQERGVTIVWGVHEVLPHECPFPDVELEFRQSLVNLADVVQVLHASTNDALNGAFTIPAEKTLVVPHPLYRGAQADHVTRAAVRADLGYGSSDLMLLGIGSIRPYKGYERVVRMMPSLQRQLGDRRLTFVIAGPAQSDTVIQNYIAGLETEIARLPDPTAVHLVTGTVPENYLQMLLRSADVAVAPYRDGLNSGVLLLNMTFGLPTVIASNVVTDEISQFGPVSTFPVGDDEALREALIDRLTAVSMQPVDPQFIAANSPAVISADFAQALRTHLRRPDAEVPSSPAANGDQQT